LKGALSILLAISFAAAADPQKQPSSPDEKTTALEEFLKFEQGQRPEDATSIASKREQALTQIRQFTELMSSQPRTLSANCRRFSALALRLLHDLGVGVESYPNPPPTPLSDSEFELSNRMQIEAAAYFTVVYFLQNNKDAGFNPFDPAANESCAFPARDELKKSSLKTLNDLNTYMLAAFGSPSLEEIDHNQRRLLKLAIGDENAENARSWLYAGIFTVASAVLWETAPVAVLAGIRTAVGYTPRLLLFPIMTYGIRVSALTAEGFAFVYTQDLATQHPETPKVLLGSWDEYMNSIDSLIESPRHAPQVQMALLGRVQGMIFQSILPWLSSQDFTISASGPTPRISSVRHVEMLNILSDASVENQLHRLPHWLEQQFNYRPQCDDSFVRGVSLLKCLSGMRALSTALINGQLPTPPEPLTVVVGPQWHKMQPEQRVAKVSIPYTAEEREIVGFLNREIHRPAYAERLRLLTQIEDLRVNLEGQAGKEIEISDQLTNLQAAAGLYGLELYLRKSGAKLDGPSEVITISDAFRLPYEDELKIKEDIRANASLADMQTYLSQANRQGYGDGRWPKSFFEEREALNGEMKAFADSQNLNRVMCSPSSALSQHNCRLTLKRLGKALTLGVKTAKLDTLIIMGSDEIPQAADYFLEPKERKNILLVRSGFGLAPLMRQFNDWGWLEDSSGGVR